jgi:hypothetical protein
MLSMFIPALRFIPYAVGAVGGVILGLTYANIFVVPSAKREAAKVAQSEMIEKFKDASNELASDAEKFRANRLACGAAGGVFDFATGNCRQD